MSAAGIAAIAVMRAVVAISPDPSFGSDPFLDPTPSSAIGPVGSMILDVLLIVFAALGFLGEGVSRRRVSIFLVLLALVPSVAVLWHGLNEFDDLWRGFSWCAAMIAAIAAAQLARQRELRILLASALMAIVVPLCVRGLVQFFIEHREMVETYERDREAVLAARGIEPGSSSALVFERRLEQPEATAWFGLANVFGSFMVAGLVAWTGWLAMAIRQRARLESGFAGVMALAAALAAGGLLLAGSKGAFAAAFIGLALLAIALLPQARRIPRFGGVLAIAVVVLAMAGVAIRGAILPEDFAGDRSILFRWHYWIGAGRMIAEEPLAGAGPAGFQDAFVRHRMPTTPEEAASAHNVFIDWIAMLGVFGVAWITLVGVLVWRAGESLNVETPSPPGPLPGGEGRWNPLPPGEGRVRVHTKLDGASEAPSPQPSPEGRGSERVMTSWLAVVAFAAFAPALLIEQPALDARAVFFRALGIMGYLALAALAAKALQRSDDRLVLTSIAAGAVALLVHAQVEVTLTQPSAAAWGLMLLGVASAGGARADDRHGDRAGVWIGWTLLAGVLACAIFLLAPALRQARAMEAAADRLRAIGMVRLALLEVAPAAQADEGGRALERSLEFATEANMSAETLSRIRETDSRSPASMAALVERVKPELAWRESSDRRGAAEMLRAAYRILDSNPRPWRAALEQQLTALAAGEAVDGETISAEIHQLVTAHPSPGTTAFAARAEERLAELSANSGHHARAIEYRRRLVELDPRGVGPRVALADALWRAGHIAEAKAEYRRALEQSERWHLDELRQLTKEEKERIEGLLSDD